MTSLYEKLGTTQTSKAIQNAIKDLPSILSKKIIDETSKYNMVREFTGLADFSEIV